MTKDELRSVLPGGKNHDVALKWVADDAAVLQARALHEKAFSDIVCPTFSVDIEWRIKPQVLRYRVAKMLRQWSDAKPYLVWCDDQDSTSYTESQPHFVKWVTDWVEVEV